MISERVKRLNDKVRNTQPTIDMDRARLITEFYSKPSKSFIEEMQNAAK